MAEFHGRLMGCRARLLVDDDHEHLLGDALALGDKLEQRWSRFVPSSDVSALNRAEGRPVLVAADTLDLVECAMNAWRATGGWFDPGLLDSLEALGYDRTHQQLATDPAPVGAGRDPGDQLPPLRDAVGLIEVDRVLSAIRLPVGMSFDPGGIGKGLAADRLTDLLINGGARTSLVELGGDLRVAGEPPADWESWPVQVENPFDPEGPNTVIPVIEGAVCTSSRALRRWTHHGQPQHHLLDPRTARPSESSLVSVTVLSGVAWWADVLAKATLVAGPEAGVRLIESLGLGALLIGADGTRTIAGSLGIEPTPIPPPLEVVT
ncbi:MAG: FAD:protein FMN transferase [Actinomycetia bacterium]|nr:FAD:protein FMN transferase [Actinomycetes bacterium]